MGHYTDNKETAGTRGNKNRRENLGTEGTTQGQQGYYRDKWGTIQIRHNWDTKGTMGMSNRDNWGTIGTTGAL